MITSITGFQSVQNKNNITRAQSASNQRLKPLAQDKVQFKGLGGNPKTDLPVEILRKVSELKEALQGATEDDAKLLGNTIEDLSSGEFSGTFSLEGSNGASVNHYFQKGKNIAEEIVNTTGSSTLKYHNGDSNILFHFDKDGFLKRREDYFKGTNITKRIRQYGDGLYGALPELEINNQTKMDLQLKEIGQTLTGVVHEQIFDRQGRAEFEMKQDAKLGAFLKRPGEVLMRHDFYMEGYFGPKSSKFTDKAGQVLATFHNRADGTRDFIKIFNPKRHGLAQLIECDEKGNPVNIIAGGLKRDSNPAPLSSDSWTPPKAPELDIEEPELPKEPDTSWMDPPSDGDPEDLF